VTDKGKWTNTKASPPYKAVQAALNVAQGSISELQFIIKGQEEELRIKDEIIEKLRWRCTKHGV
jgi:hypothetical protein